MRYNVVTHGRLKYKISIRDIENQKKKKIEKNIFKIF